MTRKTAVLGLAFALGLGALAWAPPPAQAQTVGEEELRIVAVVNDEVISAFDLANRLRFVLVTAGIPVTEQSMQRLAPQVIRTMIEEKIKLQEGKRFGIEPDQDAVARQLSLFEKQNNIPEGQLADVLERNGASVDQLVKQIESDNVWRRIINGRYGSEVTISDEDVDDVIAELEAKKGQAEYRIAEIFIPTEAGEIAEAQQTIRRLVQELKSGADFRALASSFSRAPSAVQGGDLGYIQLDRLGSELAPVAAQLAPGQLSEPIQTPLGFYLLLMIDQQTSPGLPTGTVTLSLAQYHLSLPAGADDATVAAAAAQAGQATAGVRGCDALLAKGTESGSPLSGRLGTLEQSQLPPAIRDAVDPLDVGQPSEPVRTADGMSVLMVCEREGGRSMDDIREDIRSRLKNDRLADIARQYLRDLKRSALIEIRQ